MWTPTAKMTKAAWAKLVPKLKKAIDKAKERRSTQKAKVWQDNERFLQAPAAYKKEGMQIASFPTNSGDLNPIETVWARLRLDLAKLEQKDFCAKPRRFLTEAQFKARVAMLLDSYGQVKPGETYSYLQKLVRGMPGRLRKRRSNTLGRCGK